MKTNLTFARITMALAIALFPFLKANAWDWEWTDTWGEAVAWCEECGNEYIIYADNSAEAESAAEDLFCSDCGCCSEDVNMDCYREHHCQFCDGCIDNGEYHVGIYNLFDEYIHYDCAIELIESGDVDACSYCHELFGEGAVECDCGVGDKHCTDCSESKCEKCGKCLLIAGDETDAASGDACIDHGICGECMPDASADDQTHCRICFNCDEDICDECGMCESCAVYEEHCPECGYCFGDEVQWCADDGEHCVNCCKDNGWLCPACERCVDGAGIYICDDCGMCEECCLSESEGEGCIHGICTASSEFYDHLCPECGECPQDEECDYCGLCINCQTGYHCEHELCPDGSEWDDHVCPDCGECFDDGELCEFCGLCENCREHCEHDFCPENDDDSDHFICNQCGDCFEAIDRCDECELCLVCCDDNTQSMGCDHGFCVVSDDFEEHWCYEDDQCLELCEHDPECTHSNVTLDYAINGNAHWRVCEDCGLTVDKAQHTGGEPVTLTSPNAATHTNGTAQVNCIVCNYKMGIVPIPYVEAPADGSPYIIIQPTDYTGKTNTAAWKEEEDDRYATFKVKAGGEGLSYQWYCRYGTGSGTKLSDDSYTLGTQTPTLKTLVYGEDCERQNRNIYCIVSNSKGSVTSDAAYFKAEHVFGRYTKKDNETHENHCFGEGCSVVKATSKHRFTEWTLVRPATSSETGLREQQCMDCAYKKSESIPMVEPDHVHSYDIAKYNMSQHWFVCACGIAGPDAAVDHVFDESEVVTPATETKRGENRIICSACGFFKTEKTDKLPHVHDWYTFGEISIVLPNGHSGPDPKKGSYGPNSHTIKCKGCNEKKTDRHVWGMFECMRDAKVQGNDTIAGRIVRYCDICSYKEEKFYPLGSWPIMIAGGTAYKGLTNRAGQVIKWIPAAYAKKGDKIEVAYDALAARSLGDNQPQKFVEWVDGASWIGETNIPWDNGRSSIDLPRLTFRLSRTTRRYGFTMPDGPATIFAVTEACDHSGSTKQTARVEPTCSSHGYEPSTLCADCDEVLEEGARIPALGHDLPSTPIAGTEVVEYCTTWVQDYNQYGKPNTATHGYTGDFLCNRCGQTVKGEPTPLRHGKHDKNNQYIRPGYIWTSYQKWVEATNPPTCTKAGYEDDLYCIYCNKLVQKGERVEAHGHDWESWYVVREATTKVKGMEQRVCAYDYSHVETRITDYSGPDYTLKPERQKLRFEWTYGEPVPSQTITFKSTGRDSIGSIEYAEEPNGYLDVTVDGMTITAKPNIDNVKWERSDMEYDVVVTDLLTPANETIESFTVPEIKATCIIKKTPEKYLLTVEDGLATTFTMSRPEWTYSTDRSNMLKVRGGEFVELEPEDEWKHDFLRWEVIKGSDDIQEDVHESRTKNTRFVMSPADVTIRAIYRKNAPTMKFKQTEVTASVEEPFKEPALITIPGKLPVTYSSSDERVVRVNPKTGTVSFMGAGTAVITATSAETNHYASSATSYTLIVPQDFITGIKTLSGSPLKGEGMFNTGGQRVGDSYRGIVVTKNKKELKK